MRVRVMGGSRKHLLIRPTAGAEAKGGPGNDESEDEVGGRAQGPSWDSFSPGKVGAMAGLEPDGEWTSLDR